MGLFSGLKSFDAYPKIHDDMKVRTIGGAVLSLCAMTAIVLLFFSELGLYMVVNTEDHLYVDLSRNDKLKINFDVAFPNVPCDMLNVDALDVTGQAHDDAESHIVKTPLDSDMNPMEHERIKTQLGELAMTLDKDQASNPIMVEGYCGSCYGAQEDHNPGQCCNTCDDVITAFKKKGMDMMKLTSVEQCKYGSGASLKNLEAALSAGHGCHMAGFLQVNKVAGNLHFAPGMKSAAAAHTHEIVTAKFDASHEIRALAFGDTYPGIVNPLDGEVKTVGEGTPKTMYLYYAKVVPTTYAYMSGSQTVTNQYSVTEHQRVLEGDGQQGLPGLFIFYEIAPIMVEFTETRESLAHFLTQLCAILGGVFTVVGMVDRVVYAGMRQIERKMEIGKLS